MSIAKFSIEKIYPTLNKAVFTGGKRGFEIQAIVANSIKSNRERAHWNENYFIIKCETHL